MLERVTAAPLARRPAVPGPADPEGASGRPAEVRRRELAEFLRSRRERLRSDHVGLPVTGRRRTPGLRREEVAALAGVGVTWYTWLEQARNVTPSAQVLEAISRALQLDGPEQTHLFVLAGLGPSRPAEAAPAVDPGVAHLLRQLEPFPAVLSNARYDLLAYNSTYRHVISDLDLLPPQERNTVWLMACHPAWREAVVDHADLLARLIGQFRAGMAQQPDDPGWRQLLRRLRAASPEFVEQWERHEVRGLENMVKTLVSPRAGLLRLRLTHLWLDPALTQRISVYSPIDDDSRRRLVALAASVAEPGAPATTA